MAGQNINQYVKPNWSLKLNLESNDMSLTSDERDFNQEVVFSPHLIAEGYGNRLPVYFDINNPLSVQPLILSYKSYNSNNIFVSKYFYNEDNLDLTCFTAQTSCDIGLTGTDNGLVANIVGNDINFTNGLFDDSLKFERLYFDRRLKMFQVTGYTDSPNIKFSGFNKTVLYEVVSKEDSVGKYHELYGGFYQGFYKLFGYDYEILPERMNKGWTVEMLLKPRLINEYTPGAGETTLNEIYPENKNMFFYFGTRAENKYYHHADGIPNCFVSTYNRVTTPLSGCFQTCACCNPTVTNSRCIYVYPPRSVDNLHDPHANYGCNKCKGVPDAKISCGCSCYDPHCTTCGWECQTHICIPPVPNEVYTVYVYYDTIEPSTPTPTPTGTPGGVTPTPTPTQTSGNVYSIFVNYDIIEPLTLGENTKITGDILSTTINLDLCDVEPLTPVCTPTCDTCDSCDTCYDTTGYTSIENTCESNPLFDAMDNALGFKLCGEPENPQIGVRVLRFTGDCVTTGSCSTTGITYTTGYTVDEYCTPPIYPFCLEENPEWLLEEHWFQVNFVWERYTWLDTCDLWYRGGLGDITEEKYLESLANNAISLITAPYTHQLCNIDPEKIKWVSLNEKWLLDQQYRNGRLKIYVNGKLFYTIEDFKEIIPRALTTDKEKQVGVPYNISWGGGTQGLRENLTLTSCLLPYGPYQQDPECFPTNDFEGTSLEGSKTNIVLEETFAGTFEGGISQFRMYMTPLSAPEVKHNFNLLKDQFNMFNPDCPNCDTQVCVEGDITYEVVENIPPNICFSYDLILPEVLGRVYVPDARDNNHLISTVFPKQTTKITSKYWDANMWWGNQGSTPQCVGYAWAHWIADGPITHSGAQPPVNPTTIYKEAQKVDEWPGERYDGTSVRGGAKYLKTSGKISSYLWAFDINTLVNTVLNVGPVVVGTNWYNGMFYPDKTGLIRITGRLAGGHAYVINGVDTRTQRFRIKNSWGKTWGQSGHAYISYTDMARLIRENGEICLAIENKF
jgi:hypothetical protein